MKARKQDLMSLSISDGEYILVRKSMVERFLFFYIYATLIRPHKTMENLQNFTQNLRKIRVEKELSQENVAIELGMNREAYLKLETGKTNLNVDQLDGLSKVFKMDFVELLIYNNKKYSIVKTKDKVLLVKNDPIEAPQMVDEPQPTVLQQVMTHNQQLLAHNQQLIAEGQRLRQALGGV